MIAMYEHLGFYMTQYETHGSVYSKLLVVRDRTTGIKTKRTIRGRLDYVRQTEDQNQVEGF